MGFVLMVNMVVLGYFVVKIGVVKKENVEEVIRRCVLKGIEEINFCVFRVGYEEGLK